jgi:hypothetical protein
VGKKKSGRKRCLFDKQIYVNVATTVHLQVAEERTWLDFSIYVKLERRHYLDLTAVRKVLYVVPSSPSKEKHLKVGEGGAIFSADFVQSVKELTAWTPAP